MLLNFCLILYVELQSHWITSFQATQRVIKHHSAGEENLKCHL